MHRTNEKSIMDLFEIEISPEEMLQTPQETEVIETVDTPEEVIEVVEDTEVDEEPEVTESEEDISESSPTRVFYDFVTENGILDEIENFDGSVETLKEHLEQLPFKSFKRAVESLPEFAQQIVNYAFSKEVSSVEEFKQFMEEVVIPATNQVVINNVEDARKYLETKYKDMGIYASEDDLLESLDLLEEKGTLIKTATSLADKDNAANKQALALKVKAEEEAKLERENKAKEQSLKLSKSIENTFKELNWQPARQQAVLENLQADVVNRKNELIRNSPKAIIQLADIYSYFDETKGEFDFSKLLDVKAQSKQNTAIKERMQKDKFSSAIAGLGKPESSSKKKSLLEVLDFEYED